MPTETGPDSQSRRHSQPQFFRFSIRHLLVWTAFVALGCVALRSSSDTWSAALHAIALGSLGGAILLVIYRAGAARAYWLGFALSGWLYLGILMYGWTLQRDTGYLVPIQPDQLITSRLSILAYQWSYTLLAPRPITYDTGAYIGTGLGGYGGGMGSGGGFVGMGGVAPPPFVGPAQHEFVNVAHALWTLLLAACGGSYARWLYLTRTSENRVGAAAT